MPQRQLALSHGLGGIQQPIADVLWRQVRVLGKDFIGRHAVRDHRDYRGHGYAQAPDAGQAAHHLWVGGDSPECHPSMLA